MKKLKKFIQDKGGWKLFLISLALILVALFFIILGCVYAYYDGNWGRIPEMLSSDSIGRRGRGSAGSTRWVSYSGAAAVPSMMPTTGHRVGGGGHVARLCRVLRGLRR